MAMSGASFVPIHATTLYGSSGWKEAAVVLRKIIRAPDKERETQAHPVATVPVDKGKTPLAVHSAQTRIRIEFWRGNEKKTKSSICSPFLWNVIHRCTRIVSSSGTDSGSGIAFYQQNSPNSAPAG
uniref:Uncharacterized protein n=1 Tax=Anopheles merus TaxID=30066 RepID=A0A182VDJ8_ANOME